MRWPLNSTPYAVQQRAFDLSDGHRGLDGFGHLMEQGLGKSAVTLADYTRELNEGRCDGLIVVAPSYLKSTWRDEHATWGMEMPICTWPGGTGSDRWVDKFNWKEPAFVTVINREAMLGKGGEFVSELMKRRRCMLALDESSFIKNNESQITKALREIKHDAKSIRLLSGTPMSQDVTDLYPQLRMMGRINGMVPKAFRNRFAVMGGFKGKQITGIKNEKELHEILDECSFRALKVDWWDDCPEKIPVTREFEMGGQQTTAYRSMVSEMYAMVHGHEVLASQAIHMMMKAQQISRGFIYDTEHDRLVREFMPADKNPAIKLTQDIVSTTYGKCIIFAYYKPSVENLYKVFGGAILRGGMDEAEIKEQKRRFNDDPTCRTIVCQLSVGAKGHTLLGGPGPDRCSTTIYYENEYSLETRKQSEDRNHRYGQDRAVVYIDLVGSAMDNKVISALQKKQELVTAVVDAVRSYQ